MSFRVSIRICILIFLLLQGEARADTFTFVTSNYPPYQYMENGEAKGFKLDILQEAFRRAGHDFTTKFVPWSRVLKVIETGGADFTTGQFTEKRALYTDYNSISVSDAAISLFVKSEAEIQFSGDLTELRDYRFLGVIKYSYGKAFDEAVEDGIIKKLDRTTSTENAVLMLYRGRGDVFVGDRVVGIDTMNKKGWSKAIRELKPAIDIQPTLMMYSKKKKLFQLRKDIDMALQSMIDDGTFKRLSSYELNPSG